MVSFNEFNKRNYISDAWGREPQWFDELEAASDDPAGPADNAAGTGESIVKEAEPVKASKPIPAEDVTSVNDTTNDVDEGTKVEEAFEGEESTKAAQPTIPWTADQDDGAHVEDSPEADEDKARR